MTERRLLSVPEAAERAGVSVKTIRRAYQAGELACERPGGRRRVVIPEDGLEQWVCSGRSHAIALAPASSPSGVARLASPRRDEPGSLGRLRAIEARRTS